MSDKTWLIYKITGNCGRAYVGLTSRAVILRWRTHILDAANGSTTFLHRAMRKYGVGWFTITTLCECYTKREAVIAERALIAAHNTYAHAGGGFNLTYGGDGNWGWKPSDEVKAKIGAKSAERIAANPDYVRKMVEAREPGMKRPWAAAQAIKLGKAKKGIKLSQEHIAKSSASRVGIKHTEEAKKKISVANKGRIKTPEEIKKISDSKRGKKLSPEAAAKCTAALAAGNHLAFTPEALEKRRISRIKTGANKKVGDACRRRNSDPAFQHHAWCMRMYQNALNKRGKEARLALREKHA